MSPLVLYWSIIAQPLLRERVLFSRTLVHEVIESHIGLVFLFCFQVQCFEPKLKRLIVLRRWVQIKRRLTTALTPQNSLVVNTLPPMNSLHFCQLLWHPLTEHKMPILRESMFRKL